MAADGLGEGKLGRLGPGENRVPVVADYGGSINPWGGDEALLGSTVDLAEYWRILVKYRVVIMVVFVTVLALGGGGTLMMRPVYSAKATIQIDREAARIDNADDAEPRDTLASSEEFFQTQYGLLKSRALAIRVMDSLGLASSDAFLNQMGGQAGKAFDQITVRTGQESVSRRDQVLRRLQKNLGVNPVRGSRLVSLAFDSPDPMLSARIANAFAENFIQSNLDRKFESSSYARDFLEKRIAETKAKLEESERQLVAYATQQQIINVGEPGDKSGASQSLASINLVALNTALATATTNRVQAEERWREARSAPLLDIPDVLQSATIQKLIQDRAALTAEYQQKLSLYKPDFPEMLQLKAQIDEGNRQIMTEAQQIRASIAAQYEIALKQEESLKQKVSGLKGDVMNLRDRSVEYNILQREVDTSRTLYDGLLQRYKEIGVAGGVATNNISIVDRAEPPLKPSKPNVPLNFGLAALMGLGLGVLAAFAAEGLDESIIMPEDVETKIGLPVLGSVPLLEKGVTPAAALADLRSGFSEAYYSLRTALQFSTPDGVPSTLLITSSRSEEGKSTSALAIALNMARVGARVLLVDGDLRNPSMHRMIGADNARGFSNVLAGAAPLMEVIQETRLSNLSFVACGPLPPNPAELLAGARLRAFLDEATQAFDLVVIDGPPILGLADAPILASVVGGTLFVVESRATRRGQAKGALRRLRVGRPHILGVVLTKFNTVATWYGSGYDYAYDYKYGEKSPKKRRSRGHGTADGADGEKDAA